LDREANGTVGRDWVSERFVGESPNWSA
jgi:hypothetical protein